MFILLQYLMGVIHIYIHTSHAHGDEQNSDKMCEQWFHWNWAASSKYGWLGVCLKHKKNLLKLYKLAKIYYLYFVCCRLAHGDEENSPGMCELCWHWYWSILILNYWNCVTSVAWQKIVSAKFGGAVQQNLLAHLFCKFWLFCCLWSLYVYLFYNRLRDEAIACGMVQSRSDCLSQWGSRGREKLSRNVRGILAFIWETCV